MSYHSLESRFAAAWPRSAWQDVPVLLAVSGGADSVALYCLMVDAARNSSAALHIAHFNHGLRADEALADQQFVERLVRPAGLPFHVGSADSPITQQGDGLEAAARQTRYEFLQTTAEKIGARYLATAHTADDQAETILMHVIRGTGLAGLVGMPRIRNLSPAVTLIRPLLGFRRRELVEYLQARDQPWRNDATNRNLDFTRNRVRHELLPTLVERYHAGTVDSLLRLGRLAADAQAALEPMVVQLLDDAWPEPRHGPAVHLNCQPLAAAPTHLVREAFVRLWRDRRWPLQDMSLDHWQSLAELAQSELVQSGNARAELVPSNALPSAITFPSAIQARRTGNALTLAPTT